MKWRRRLAELLRMRDIRVAILADDRPGFVKVMAEGLRRSMAAAGAEAHIFSNGLEALRHLPARGSSHHVRAIARRMFKDLPRRLYRAFCPLRRARGRQQLA